MIKHRLWSPVSLALFLAVALFIVYGSLYPALAIGPGTGGSKIRVNDEQIGPYTLLVATAPLPVTAGQMSVWVRVTETETNELRRNAIVMVSATPQEGGSMVTAQGSHKNAGNNFDYVAHLEVQQSGQWNVTITIEDELGQAETVFVETVTRRSNLTTVIALAMPFIALVVVVGMYFWRRASTG